MIQLLIMNGMGSLFYALHRFFDRFEQKFMMPVYRLFIYRLNLLLFVIPFPAVLFYVRRYFDSFVSRIPVSSFYLNGSHVIVHLGKNISFALPKLYYILILVLIAWIVAIIRVSKHVSNEYHKTHNFDSYFRVFGEEEMAKSSIDVNSLLDTALKEMNMKKKPRIYIHELVSVPYTSGVLQPTIYLPSNWNVPEAVYYMTIKHELAHIKHKDLIFEYISYIAGIINFFNPLVDHIYLKIKNCEELAADACACKGASRKDRNSYQTAILDLSATNTSAPNRKVRGLIYKIKFYDNTKERILTMKNKNLNKHKLLKLAATAFMSAALFTVSTIPALAYNLPSALEVEDTTVDPIDIFGVNVLSTENKSSSSLVSIHSSEGELYSFLENLDFSESDFVCIDENGVVSHDMVDPQWIECNHNYLAAQATHHDKNSDGSCTVTYYNAKRCSKCGRIVIMERQGVMSFDKCPH